MHAVLPALEKFGWRATGAVVAALVLDRQEFLLNARHRTEVLRAGKVDWYLDVVQLRSVVKQRRRRNSAFDIHVRGFSNIQKRFCCSRKVEREALSLTDSDQGISASCFAQSLHELIMVHIADWELISESECVAGHLGSSKSIAEPTLRPRPQELPSPTCPNAAATFFFDGAVRPASDVLRNAAEAVAKTVCAARECSVASIC